MYAFAGRNKEKLERTLESARANTGLDLAKAELLVVDVNDEESLKKMAAQTKVVINCVGPVSWTAMYFLREYNKGILVLCVSVFSH